MRWILFSVIGIVMSCRQDSSYGIFQIDISNISNNNATKLVEIDLVPVDTAFKLFIDTLAIPFQTEDWNDNGIVDKLFFILELPPRSEYKITATPVDSFHFPSARTQVVLKRQTLDYDPQNPFRLSNEYVNARQIQVPPDLIAQNTWIWHEGIAWENEIIGYRAYLDRRSIFDIFGKITSRLVLDTITGDLHEMQSWGADILQIGTSFGIGSPGIYDFDSIYTFSNYKAKNVEILASGPIRSIVRIDFLGLQIRGEEIDIRMYLEMVSGRHWTEVKLQTLRNERLNIVYATGITRRPRTTGLVQGKELKTDFCYTFGLQASHGENMGMAILIPDKYDVDVHHSNPESHILLIHPINDEVTYRFMATWEKGPRGINDEVDFINLVRNYAKAFTLEDSIRVHYLPSIE